MKVNLKLLKDLYLINHPSGSENPMISFILNYCYKIPKLSFELDHYNNLFITKNTTNPEHYVCIVAHLDSVHNIITPRNINIKNGVISSSLTRSNIKCGLNADDCNGILVALQLLEKIPNLKVCFTTEEEVGGVGASETKYNRKFFENVNYLIQADRRGSSDLIYFTNGIITASSEFIADISDLMDKYNYNLVEGVFTDIGIISDQFNISGINVSCGYYNEHTTDEVCVISELQNCLNFVYEIITTVPDKKYSLDNPRYPCEKCSEFNCFNCSYYTF